MEETNHTQSQQKDILLPISIIVAALMISGSIIYMVAGQKGTNQLAQLGQQQQNQDGPDLPPTPVGDRDVILGNKDAPVTILEYGDYQCPFCAKFFESVEPQLIEKYVKTGKARLVFRNFQFLGPESLAAGGASECAKDQGKFWEFHNALYTAESKDGKEHNGNLNRALFVQLATNSKMNMPEFQKCIDDKKYEKNVADDATTAQGIGVNSTPTVYVNDQKFVGALPFEQFQEVIDKALAGK